MTHWYLTLGGLSACVIFSSGVGAVIQYWSKLGTEPEILTMILHDPILIRANSEIR